MIAVGPRNFRAFLDGAHEMDEHFQSAPLNAAYRARAQRGDIRSFDMYDYVLNGVDA